MVSNPGDTTRMTAPDPPNDPAYVVLVATAAEALSRARMQMVDAHNHLRALDEVEYPDSRPGPRGILGNYDDIAHDYDPAANRSDLAGLTVTQTVACEFGGADPVAEVTWIQRSATRVPTRTNPSSASSSPRRLHTG